jgi:hypothetical protein
VYETIGNEPVVHRPRGTHSVRILVACAFVPFTQGGGRAAADQLAEAIHRRGLEADVAAFPIDPDAGDPFAQLLGLRVRHLDLTADRLICVDSPACLLRHPHKRVWLDETFGLRFANSSNSDLAQAHSRAFEEANLVVVSSEERKRAPYRFTGPAELRDRPESEDGWDSLAAVLSA